MAPGSSSRPGGGARVILLSLAGLACHRGNPAYKGRAVAGPDAGGVDARDAAADAPGPDVRTAGGLDTARDVARDGARDAPPPLAANGAACNSGPECASGICGDGVCCKTACTGACVACNLATSMGQCTAKPLTTLVGYWKLDAASGTMAADSSCSGLDGTLVGYASPDWMPGKVGGALAFDGVGQWLKVPDTNDRLDAIAAANTFTLMAWSKRRSVSQNPYVSLVQRQFQDTVDEHYAIDYRDLYGGQPGFTMSHYNRPVMDCTSSVLPPLDQWVHLAGTYDGTIGRLYVDGVEACSFSYAATLEPDAKPIAIGAGLNQADETVREAFDGLIDEVLIYSRALSASEIAAIASGGAPPGQ